MNYEKIPYKSIIHLPRGSSTRSLIPLQQKLDLKLYERCTHSYKWKTSISSTMGTVHFVSTTTPAKQKQLQIQRNRGRWIIKFIDEMSKMQRTEFTCPQRRNEFWQTKSEPSLCTSLYAGRMRWKKLWKKTEKKNVRKTTYVSKGPEVTLRNTCGITRIPTFQSCLGKPMVICARGTLTQFHQRVAIVRTRIYTNKQYIQRIKEFSSMMLSRHRRIIPSLKRSWRRCTFLSILDRFQIIQ